MVIGGTASQRPVVAPVALEGAGLASSSTPLALVPPGDGIALAGFTPEEARWMLGCLSRDVRREARIGKRPPSFAANVFDVLDRLAGTNSTTTRVTRDSGTPSARIGVGDGSQWISVRASAATTGLSESYVRVLCRAGRVRAIRPGGRAYLIDADSLPRRKAQ